MKTPLAAKVCPSVDVVPLFTSSKTLPYNPFAPEPPVTARADPSPF